MSRPTKFQIMRANRERKPSVLAQIDSVEEEVTREWAAHRARVEAERRACFADTEDWIRRTCEEARELKAASEPDAVQVLTPPRGRRRWWLFGRRATCLG